MIHVLTTNPVHMQVFSVTKLHENVHIHAASHGTVYIQVPSDSITEHLEISIETAVHVQATVILLCTQPTFLRIVQTGHIAECGTVDVHVYTVSTGSIEHTITHTVEQYACSNITYVSYASLHEHMQCTIENIFSGVSGRGLITIHGIAEHAARLMCNGKITITKSANHTDAYLTENILMLDRTAQVHAVPSLEIKTNDVKASHSATIVHITPADLFYFSARGIATDTARRMYIESFFSAHIDALPESIQIDLLQALAGKLPAVDTTHGVQD